ncbi:Rod shape-determining protein mreD [Granulibacter bethesdensis]|uniref:Rod shape-determining protein mreD n=1 Tax=Granulibacter bethesdensis TaxID=364410 RepID=A0AAC9P912_9PROT|nr:hypothetical protein [Granulibacter bethesdensis]APH54770.1 Rod shape-determining protein mreD [Granulibacter bethesdensis]APH62356.1 Rod shape-determining protein mreD [Granulibacter bethesdensis]
MPVETPLDRVARRLNPITPRQTMFRRLDHAARSSLPVATTILLLVTLNGPLGLPAQAELPPATMLACVFFWSLFRPRAMPPLAVFLIGVLADLLGQFSIGVSELALLAAQAMALRLRRGLSQQGFMIVWLAYALVASLCTAVIWFMQSLLTLTMMPPGPALLLATLSIGFYPALAVLFTRAHRGITDPDPV